MTTETTDVIFEFFHCARIHPNVIDLEHVSYTSVVSKRTHMYRVYSELDEKKKGIEKAASF